MLKIAERLAVLEDAALGAARTKQGPAISGRNKVKREQNRKPDPKGPYSTTVGRHQERRASRRPVDLQEELSEVSSHPSLGKKSDKKASRHRRERNRDNNRKSGVPSDSEISDSSSSSDSD